MLGRQSRGEVDRRLIAFLRRAAARALRVDPARLRPDRSLSALGLDSLAAVELAGAIESSLGVEVTLASLLEGPTLAELAARLAPVLAARVAADAGADAFRGAAAAERHEARGAGAATDTGASGVTDAGASGVTDTGASAAASGAAAAVGISSLERFPLSHGQRALWLLDRLVPGGNPAYVLAGAARVRGELAGYRLHNALRVLVRRHPALRTRFEADGDGAIALVSEEPTLSFVEEDAAGWGEERFQERLGEEAHRPFDLARGPLLRVALLHLGAEEQVVVLAVHHIAADFWSLGVLLGELGALLRGDPLPPIASSYADFVRRQAELLAGAAGERLEAWWRAALAGGAASLELPTDRPRPALQSFRGGSRSTCLPPALAARLCSLGRGAGATPFMTLLAAFMTLLHRTSGQDEVRVGTPVAGRSSAALAGLVGYFVNPVVVRGELAGNPGFGELVGRVRQAAIAAFAHQDYPFALLAERLGGERDPGRSPIFQAMFAFYRERRSGEHGLGALALGEGGARLDLGGLALESVRLPRRAAQFDLTLLLAETGGRGAGLAGSLVYDRDLFDGATAARMLGQLHVLAAAAAADPACPVGALPWLSAGERQQLLEWNDTTAAWPSRHCLHQLIEAQVRRRPEAVALVVDETGESLTFRRLNAQANRLARRLRRLGVGPEKVAALCVERSAAMVVGLLAILKAGGAYLPLAPDDPVERLRFMLRDAGAAVLLAPRELAARWGEHGIRAVHLDELPGAAGAMERRRSAPNLRHLALPDNLAYVIYTSGSTGSPKGTMNTHRGIVNRLLWMQDRYRLAADDRVLQKTPFTFDVSVWELFWPLLAGGCLVMARPGGHRDSAYLQRAIAGQEITTLHFVPSMLRAFLDDAAQRPSAPLPWPRRPRQVFASGEALPHDLQQQFHAAFGVPLHNLYGPTEAAVDVTWWACDPARPRVVPIGRPVANTRVHLLDRRGREVPVGVPGELCIGGVQLARGYLGRAGLTAASFVPDPFAGGSPGRQAAGEGEPGARLYRTGDLARWLPDGAIEFLGRGDGQVKIRGRRIELGEIEAALAAHPAVQAAAVAVYCLPASTAPGDGGGIPEDRRLVAYVVLRAGPAAGTSEVSLPAAGTGVAGIASPVAGTADGSPALVGELRRALAERLPGAMVPADFVVLDRLPLTASGKLDRRALPAPPPRRRTSGGSPGAGAPRGAVEELLADVWAELLGVAAGAPPAGAFEVSSQGVGIFHGPAEARDRSCRGSPSPDAGAGGGSAVRAEDHFFELGGHSLLATRLLSRVRRLFGVELPLRWVFENPTFAAQARELAAMVAAAGASPPPSSLPPLLRAAVLPRPVPPAEADSPGGDLVLSFAQERLWFLERLTRGSAAYHLPGALCLSGRLDAAALARALNEVARRHQVLRSAYPEAAGRPSVVVLRGVERRLPLVDLARLGEAAAGVAAGIGAALGRRPFDLAAGPPLRAALLRLAPEEHWLVLVLHHIAADGWSLGILAGELAVLHAAFAAGRPSPLGELPVQYSDFARWQRGWLVGEALAAHLAFWRRALAGAPARLQLPADRPRPPAPSFRGERIAALAPPGLAAELRGAARRNGATLFMVLLATLDLLLQRSTGQQDLVVGAAIANRERLEIEGLIGCFVNTLALRADLSGRPSLDELLRQVRETSLAAYAHQDLPFEKLVEALAAERDPGTTPVFQVLLVLQNTWAGAGAWHDAGAPLVMRPRQLAIAAAKFDLTLDAAETPRGLELSFELSRDLFDAATVKRLAGHYLALLAALPGDPARRLDELPALGAAERQQLLREWNDTALGRGEVAPAAARIHELFEWQAARRPEALAVRGQGATLSYGELERRANRLARALRRLGVGAETRVGLCVERSPEMVVALLGILKAGAAYVPLDPGHPGERSALVLADSAVAVLVTEERWLASLDPRPAAAGAVMGQTAGQTANAAVAILCLDREAARIAAEDGSPLGAAAAAPPAALAYVIYTSGSTGRPKGVGVSHRAVVNLLRALAERPGFDEAVVMPALATLSFDVAGAEIYLPLAVGGRVEVVGREEAATGRRLAARLRAAAATAMQATPATWRLLLDAGWQGQAGLAAISTGEALPGELAGALLERGVVLWNLYGPTETAIYAAGAPVGAPGQPALGRPLANTTLHVADGSLMAVPIGVAGELLIGGEGLARGYWGRPELTAERFVPDPWSGSHEGGRLYRTGDLVRRRCDGELEFLGRLDHQVKVRGVRIEPGEVEAALARHPGVSRAVVVAAGEGAGRRLVAYLVARTEGTAQPAAPRPPASRPPAGDGTGTSPAALREFLRRLLPEAMVPSAFMVLDRLPLTPSGKVDRKALPAPVWGSGSGDGAAARNSPRTPAERSVARLWAEVLGVAEVGGDDNFFDLGGHSLLLAQLHARLEDLLGREISLLDLFLHPTVRAQAAHLFDPAGPAAIVARPEERPPPARSAAPAPPAGVRPDGIAIVGMAGRFPGARDVEELWQNLRDGVDCVYRFGDEELLAAGVDAALLRHPRYVKAGGLVDGEELFDAAFFDYAPREAELIDPQHRLFLECACEALERAGHCPESFPGAIGVYAGTGHPGYFLRHLAGHAALLATVGERAASLGNSLDYLTTRVSYKLNLRGPSLDLQTACSTSLVAVHLACQALQAGECDLALAGGAELRVPQRQGYLHEEGGIESASGVCRAFDAGADGTVWGSGAGVVVLRRLADSLADGDNVQAVILGTAINNDGAAKLGFTAPSIAGQAEVIATAQARAGCAPESIGYVECHGTGTPLGDPVEVAALARAFGPRRAQGSCALGSIKTNLGHLGAAAGIAGLIKAALALERREIPASLHFDRPNPRIDFAAGPFHVNAELAAWRTEDGAARRAGVSSFGIGGTNAHAVLQEAPPREPGGPARRWQVVLLSARSEPALEAATDNLSAWLAGPRSGALADACYTLQLGRRAFACRRALVCRDAAEAGEALAGRDPRRLWSRRLGDATRRRPVVFLLPGQGTQHLGMGRGLYDSEPVFRRELDACAELLAPLLGGDLRQALYPPAARRADAARELGETRLAQPALFAVEYALARLWMAWGVAPWAMLGHSLGELVAACLAGVLSLADALALVTARGRWMQDAPGGAMLAIELAESDLAPLLPPAVELAAVNGPADCTVSGPEAAVAELAARLGGRGVASRRLHTAHAFHSAAMDPVGPPLAALVARMERRAPAVPWVSNLTGDWIGAGEAADPAYWAAQLRRTVRFGAGVERLLAAAAGAEPLFLEVGPGRTLCSLVSRCQVHPAGSARTVRPARTAPADPDAAAVGVAVDGTAAAAGTVAAHAIPSLRHPQAADEDERVLAAALARLWLGGAEIDWQAVHAGERRRRLPLPTYPFQRQRHWIEPAAAAAPGLASASVRNPGTVAAASEPAGGAPGVPPAFAASAGEGSRLPAAPGAASEGRLTAVPGGVPGVSRAGSSRLAAGVPLAVPELPLAMAVAPIAAAEARVVELFERLLGVAGVGVHDSFFDLGGHSLLGTRLIALVAAELGVELPIGALFDAPTPAELARLVVAAATVATVAGIAGGPGSPAVPDAAATLVVPIERAPRQDLMPASFAQQRLWFMHQLLPGSPLYVVPLAVRVRGSLSPPLLAACLAEVVRRHESLRTSFYWTGAELAQAIASRMELPLAVVDLAALTRARPALGRREAERLAHAESRRPFDLQAAPLLRVALVRLAGDDHRLLATMSHLVSDGWSVGLLIRELALLYAARQGGRPSPLPRLPVQYADYAAWQRRRLSGAALAAELTFWRDRLAGTAPLDLPTDRPRPVVPGQRGGARPLQLPKRLVSGLERLCRVERVTLFMALLAAFAELLHRYTGQTDVTIGTPVAGRTHPQTADLIGLFVNTLALRADLRGGPTVAELLGRVREAALDAFAHQELPFEKVVGELHPDRDLTRTPLFQVMVGLEDIPVAAPEVPGLRLTILPVTTRSVRFELNLALRREGGKLLGALEYRADLFDPATAARLAGHWLNLLAAIAGDPGRRLSELPLLSPAERHQLWIEWNASPWEAGDGGLLHTPVAGGAAIHPEAVALAQPPEAGEADGGSLSYGELARRAAGLARELRALGAGPEQIVGIDAEPSVEMIVGLLAILEAGGAYLPLDPAHPRERLALVLADSGARLVLAGERLAGRLPAAVRVVPLGPGSRAGIAGVAAPPVCRRLPDTDPSAHPDNAAYVLYTSGSTGAPKGVVVSHRAVANRLRYQLAMDLAPGARVLQRASLGFDVSVVEVFAPLWAGATVVLAGTASRQDAGQLARLVAEEEITNLNLPPALFPALLAEEAFRRCRSLRRVVTGGERVPGDLPRRFAAAMADPPPLLLARYGPTETTVSVAEWWCGREVEGPGVPLGRPVAGARFHVLDAAWREVPPGVSGELCIGGVCLARGYLARADLTAAAFIPDPGARRRDEAGGRLYRTGDRVRQRASGVVEFLGRVDRQVKIRGIRVELGEIEAVLVAQPAVAAAAVVVRAGRAGAAAPGGDGWGAAEGRLAAYVVARGEPPPAIEDLRGALAARLPAVMVPADWAFLARLPLTASGKLDVAALPEPAAGGGEAPGGAARIAPRTPLEALLAGLWAEVLGIERERVGVGDDFFALGGHSLLAVRLMARIRERWGRDLPLATLFRAGTVERLAALLLTGSAPAARRVLVELTPAAAGSPAIPLFFVHPAGGNILCYAELARALGPEQPLYGLQLPDPETLGPAPTVEGLAASYVAAVRETAPGGPYALGGWSLGGAIAVEMARQLDAAGEAVALLALVDPTAPRSESAGLVRPAGGSEGALRVRFVRDLVALIGGGVAAAGELASRLGPELPLAQMLAEAQVAGVLPPELGTGEVMRLFTMFRASLQAHDRFRPVPYRGRVNLLLARDRHQAAAPGTAGGNAISESAAIWAALASGGAEIETLPGDHYSILRPPAVRELAGALRRRLAAAADRCAAVPPPADDCATMLPPTDRSAKAVPSSARLALAPCDC